MAQPQAKRFSGFGVVYPDGVSGIKIVRTYTQGPSKIVNPDGSVGYTTPPPTIHELFGGGFAYADGSPVVNRIHLEMITDMKMRERAILWFDSHGKVSTIAKENIPPLDLEGKQRPEPVYVLSTDMPGEKDEITKDLDRQVMQEQVQEEVKPAPDALAQILLNLQQSIGILTDAVKDQGREIAQLKKNPPPPKRMDMSQAKHSKQSEKMKARWADPEYKAKMLSKGVLAKWKDKGVGINKRRDSVEDGKDAT